MPVTIKSQKPVAMAQTPEFKELQDKVAAAKSALDEVMTAIASLESGVGPQGGQAGQPTLQQGTPQQGMTPESITYNELERIVALTGKITVAEGGPKGYDSDGNPLGGGYDEYENNWVVTIDGKTWKTFDNEKEAYRVAAAIERKHGKKTRVYKN